MYIYIKKKNINFKAALEKGFYMLSSNQYGLVMLDEVLHYSFPGIPYTQCTEQGKDMRVLSLALTLSPLYILIVGY